MKTEPILSRAPLAGQQRRVQATEIDLVAEHLLRLEPELRRRRFSHDVTDAFVTRYAATTVAAGNIAFGYFEKGRIHALGELRRQSAHWGSTAEAAFTVERAYADRGLATHHMGLIIRAARNRGVRHLLIHFMTDNTKMKAIARHFGAELSFDGGSIVADIAPQRPTLKTLQSELVDNRISQVQSLIDFQTKVLGEIKCH